MKPSIGSHKKSKRVGRGPGSGVGKTAGRGMKGQKSRSGGYHKVGFEGGQMPLQRRLPKRGFRSMVNQHSAEIRLYELNKIKGNIVDLQSLKKANLISFRIDRAKVIVSGTLHKSLTLRGIKATQGARKKIEEMGGKLED